MTEPRTGYYAVIPQYIFKDLELLPNALRIYGEISLLCNARGYCFARDSHFMREFNFSRRGVQDWIGQLVAKGYILRHYHIENKQKERRLFLPGSPYARQVIHNTPNGECRNLHNGYPHFGRNLHKGELSTAEICTPPQGTLLNININNIFNTNTSGARACESYPHNEVSERVQGILEHLPKNLWLDGTKNAFKLWGLDDSVPDLVLGEIEKLLLARQSVELQEKTVSYETIVSAITNMTSELFGRICQEGFFKPYEESEPAPSSVRKIRYKRKNIPIPRNYILTCILREANPKWGCGDE